MRFMRLAALTAVALCLATPVLAQKQLVLVATVTDPSGAEVTQIDPKDVQFVENGTAGTIVKVEPAAAVVPKLQVLIDNGIGMPATSLGELRTALKNLINSLPTSVEVTLVSTAPQPRFLEKPTNDRIKLLSAIDRLTPDQGAGRFVDSLFEATDRINKDKQEGASYTIFSIATSSGDLNYRDDDVKQIQLRVQQKRTAVHVVLLTNMSSTSQGGIQTQLGKGLADMVGGRFEAIAVSSRLVTLLPEVGAQIAKSMAPGAKQVRITVQRPANASGNLGQIQLGIVGKTLSNVGLSATK